MLASFLGRKLLLNKKVNMNTIYTLNNLYTINQASINQLRTTMNINYVFNDNFRSFSRKNTKGAFNRSIKSPSYKMKST